MTLTSIFKNILLIIVSIIIWNTEISMIQGVGYTIALAGLAYYSIGYDQLCRLFQSSMTRVSSKWSSPSATGYGLGSLARQYCLVSALVFGGLLMFIAGLQYYGLQAKIL